MFIEKVLKYRLRPQSGSDVWVAVTIYLKMKIAGNYIRPTLGSISFY
jgi:hypothetical protein